jgi:hypothetical protein
VKRQLCGRAHTQWKACTPCKRAAYLMALDDLNERLAKARAVVQSAPDAIEGIEDLLRDLPRLPSEETTP